MQTQIRRWLPIWTLFSTNCKVTVWRTKRVKTLPATELDHFLSTEIFHEQTQETRTRAQASNNFQFSTRNCPEWKEASNCYRERRGLTFRLPLHVYMFEWFSQQPTLTFLHPCFAMLKLKYFMQGRQKPFSEFQQTAAVETFDKFRYKSCLKPCLYSTWFMFTEFVFKLVVPGEQL